MKRIAIADVTLREEINSNDISLSFKEKIEIAKSLDRLKINIIETAPIINEKTDILFLHTVSPLIKNSIISCPVGLNTASVDMTYDAVKGADKFRLNLPIPVSTVQMEFLCGKKPKAVLETAAELTAYAAGKCADIEVSLLDATRAEREFLYEITDTVIKNGAKTVTVCDSAGEMLPMEFEQFIKDIYENVPSAKDICLSVEGSNVLHMATACAISCIDAGVTQIKASMTGKGTASLKSIAHVFKSKGDALKIGCDLNMTVIDNAISAMSLTSVNTEKEYTSDIKLSRTDDIASIARAVEKLGYELNDEDLKRVFEEFEKLSEKKEVEPKELDMIVASVAMQVPPTYRLSSYVINSGNIITPTATVRLIKNGEAMQGFSVGDGPIDASFMAIEQIVGIHLELDDFQIQSITEGREATGSAIVKLRANGRLYSGKGVSTDIVGASINAYINALNKACFEENI